MKNQKPTGNFKHILLAMIIMAGSLGSISWLNPEIKDGKVVLKRTAAKVLNETFDTNLFETATPETVTSKNKNHFTIVTDDTTRLTQLVDTNKKKTTIKIIMEDADGNKKEYTTIKDMPADVRKEFLSENFNINTDLNLNLKLDSARFGDITKNLNYRFNSDVFNSNANNNYRFNNDANVFNETELKELQEMNAEFKKLNAERVEKMKADFKKANDKHLEKLNENIKKLTAKELERAKTIQKNSVDLQKMYSSPEWQKNIAELTKATTNFTNQSAQNGDGKKALDELMKQSTKFSQEFLNSPEWKKYQADLIKQDLQELRKMDQKLTKKEEDKSAKKQVGKKISADVYNQLMKGEPGYAGFDWYKTINANESKKQKEMVEKSIEMAKKLYGTMSPEIKNNLDDIAKKGPVMEEYLKSPEFAKNLEMMTKAYNTPEFKKGIEDLSKSYKNGEINILGSYFQSEEFKKNFEEMNKYYNSAEFKKNVKDLNKYYESPEYKQQIESILKGQNNSNKGRKETPTKP